VIVFGLLRHSVAEDGEMERAVGGFARWGIGADAHLVRVRQESDRADSWIDVLV
jgi:hypothetical protein